MFLSRSNKKKPRRPVIVVSGLPRSGTSMMMKMLVEGGAQVISDGVREKDSDNPNGYFELERVKQLPRGDFAWLEDAKGRVVKVVSSLLEHLPSRYSYKIIFMEREIMEVLASQRKMLANRNKSNPVEDERMKEEFQDHLLAVRAWLARQPNMDVLYVNFNSLMSDPAPLCSRIAEFLEMPLDTALMLEVPNQDLYRNRAPVKSASPGLQRQTG
ncbi:sulfotransferase [Chloroflexi bacterium CFX6]|nr:sulfotransferase [Chloroflexi bacterium CFX6]